MKKERKKNEEGKNDDNQSLKTLIVSDLLLMILVSKNFSPQIFFEPLYTFLHHLFNLWSCYKSNKVHID